MTFVQVQYIKKLLHFIECVEQLALDDIIVLVMPEQWIIANENSTNHLGL